MYTQGEKTLISMSRYHKQTLLGNRDSSLANEFKILRHFILYSILAFNIRLELEIGLDVLVL